MISCQQQHACGYFSGIDSDRISCPFASFAAAARSASILPTSISVCSKLHVRYTRQLTSTSVVFSIKFCCSEWCWIKKCRPFSWWKIRLKDNATWSSSILFTAKIWPKNKNILTTTVIFHSFCIQYPTSSHSCSTHISRVMLFALFGK